MQWCFCVCVCTSIYVFFLPLPVCQKCVSPITCLSDNTVECGNAHLTHCLRRSSRGVCVCVCLLLSLVLSQLCHPHWAYKIIQLPRTSSARSGDSVRVQLRMNHGLVLFKNDLCQRRIATLRAVDFTFKRENFVLNQ